MRVQLDRDLRRLRQEILGLGHGVERAMDGALKALLDGNTALAHRVIAGDEEIDRLEVRIEDDCRELLALHQPVASDLRLVITVLKVNNDLERVGDLAVNLARRALDLDGLSEMYVPIDLREMAAIARRMLHDSIHSLVLSDPVLARATIERDASVDSMHRDNYSLVERAVLQRPQCVTRCTCLLGASRSLERIADLATNIAEDVVFMVNGAVIRHQHV